MSGFGEQPRTHRSWAISRDGVRIAHEQGSSLARPRAGGPGPLAVTLRLRDVARVAHVAGIAKGGAEHRRDEAHRAPLLYRLIQRGPAATSRGRLSVQVGASASHLARQARRDPTRAASTSRAQALLRGVESDGRRAELERRDETRNSGVRSPLPGSRIMSSYGLSHTTQQRDGRFHEGARFPGSTPARWSSHHLTCVHVLDPQQTEQ